MATHVFTKLPRVKALTECRYSSALQGGARLRAFIALRKPLPSIACAISVQDKHEKQLTVV